MPEVVAAVLCDHLGIDVGVGRDRPRPDPRPAVYVPGMGVAPASVRDRCAPSRSSVPVAFGMLRARVPAPVAVDVSEIEGRARCDRTAAANAPSPASGDLTGDLRS
jgi:hypothetical protein